MLNMLLRGLFLIIAGVLIIAFREAFLPVIVQIVGAGFVLSGIVTLYNLYVQYKNRTTGSYTLFSLGVVGLAGFLLGAWLFLYPGFFVGILMLLLGILLGFIGFYQIVQLFALKKSIKVQSYCFILPLLLLVAGVLVIVNPFAAAGLPFYIVGVSVVLSGIFDIVSAFFVYKVQKLSNNDETEVILPDDDNED